MTDRPGEAVELYREICTFSDVNVDDHAANALKRLVYLASREQPAAPLSGEWTSKDYDTAERVLDDARRRGVKTEKHYHAAKVALDAVVYRLTPAPAAVEPLSADEEHVVYSAGDFSITEAEDAEEAWQFIAKLHNIIRKRFPAKPAPEAPKVERDVDKIVAEFRTYSTQSKFLDLVDELAALARKHAKGGDHG